MIQQRFFCALQEGILIPNSMGVIIIDFPLNPESPSLCGIFSDMQRGLPHLPLICVNHSSCIGTCHGTSNPLVMELYIHIIFIFIFVFISFINMFYLDICIYTYV